jgi:hypothetical protein
MILCKDSSSRAARSARAAQIAERCNFSSPYKRPPRKRKAVALTGPRITTLIRRASVHPDDDCHLIRPVATSASDGRTSYPNAPTSCVMMVAISRTKPNRERIGAKISSCSRAYAVMPRGAAGSA